MIELLFLFIVLMICYFAIRVNRIELRMNMLEKALNDGSERTPAYRGGSFLLRREEHH